MSWLAVPALFEYLYYKSTANINILYLFISQNLTSIDVRFMLKAIAKYIKMHTLYNKNEHKLIVLNASLNGLIFHEINCVYFKPYYNVHSKIFWPKHVFFVLDIIRRIMNIFL